MQKTCLKGTVRPPCWSVGVFYRNQVGLWLRPTFVVGSNLVCETSRLQVRDRQRPHRLFVRLFRDLVIIAFEVSNIPRYFWVCFFYYTSIDSLDESKQRQKQLGRRSYFEDFRSDFVIKLYNSFKFVKKNGTMHFFSFQFDSGIEKKIDRSWTGTDVKFRGHESGEIIGQSSFHSLHLRTLFLGAPGANVSRLLKDLLLFFFTMELWLVIGPEISQKLYFFK